MIQAPRRSWVLPLGLGLLLSAGCSEGPAPVASIGTTSPSASGSAASTPRATATSGLQEGYAGDVDTLSPLVITAVSPAPTPVRGTDGKVHVVYELQVLNASPLPATVTGIDTVAEGPGGRVLATMAADQVSSLSLLVGGSGLTPTNQVPAGRALIVLEEGVYATRADVPLSVTHRVTATFGPAEGGESSFTRLFPRQVSDVGGRVEVGREAPLVIGPPLAGENWYALNACCTLSSHRGAMLPMGGRLNGAERYAVDYSKIDVDARPVVDLQAGTIATFVGDRTRNESYLAWDQPILAVADGTVVQVVGDAPDIAPGGLPEGVAIGDLTGNRVTLDIGGGVYAQYGHLRQGSLTVTVGDRVKRGDVIARLGNSGNTSEAHLHFQLDRAVAPLIGDNVPFEIDGVALVGTLTREGLVRAPTSAPPTHELPLADSVTSYPARS